MAKFIFRGTEYPNFEGYQAAVNVADAEAKALEAEVARLKAIQPVSRLELLSLDGAPIHGVITRAATSAVVYTTKPTPKNGLSAPKDTTEREIASVTGFALVGRTADGKVRAEGGHPHDIGRPMPMTPAGIAALQAIFGKASA